MLAVKPLEASDALSNRSSVVLPVALAFPLLVIFQFTLIVAPGVVTAGETLTALGTKSGNGVAVTVNALLLAKSFVVSL